MLTIDPDQLILNALHDGFRESLKSKLTSDYSSPFTKLIESTVAAHESTFRKILNDAITSCVNGDSGLSRNRSRWLHEH